MKKVLTILAVILVTNVATFITGTMCNIKYPEVSFRDDHIEYQQVYNVSEADAPVDALGEIIASNNLGE